MCMLVTREMELLQLKSMNTPKIHHMKDLLDLFPDFDFDDDLFHDASPNVSAQSSY